MSDSTAPGYLLPIGPVAAYDDDLLDLLQPVIASIGGYQDASLVRPRWQTRDVPNQPAFETDWLAFGISRTRPDTYHYEEASDSPDGGVSVFEYSEEIDLLISCYGPHSQAFARLLYQGFRIGQNRQTLQALHMDTLLTTEPITLPGLLQSTWVRRVDLTVTFRRYLSTKYGVRTVLALPLPGEADGPAMGINNEQYITSIGEPPPYVPPPPVFGIGGVVEHADAADTSDAVSSAKRASITEPAAATESSTTIRALFPGVFEIANAQDLSTAIGMGAYLAVSTEPATALEATTAVPTLAASLIEAVNASDTSASVTVGNYLAAINEVGNAVDLIVGVVVSTASITEAAAAIATQTIGLAPVFITEPASATESSSAATARAASVLEAANAVDQPSVTGQTASAAITEAGAATDTPSGILQRFATITETGVGLDTSTVTFNPLALQLEPQTIGESISASTFGAATAAITEAATAVESSVVLSRTSDAAITEPATAIDATNATPGQFNATQTDAATATDAQTITVRAVFSAETETATALDAQAIVGQSASAAVVEAATAASAADGATGGAFLASINEAATATAVTGLLTTTAFTETQAAFGFFGFFDLAVLPGKRCWQSDESTWTGYITGSSVTMAVNAGGPNPFIVNVDGGADVNPTVSSGLVTLFSGLPDVPHFVQVRGDPGYTPQYSNTFTTGTFLSVTGAAPAIAQGADMGTAWQLTDPAAPLLHGMDVSAAPGGTITPNLPRIISDGNNYQGGSVLLFQAKAESVWLFTGDQGVWYSIDGGAMVNVVAIGVQTNQRRWRKVVSGLDPSVMHTFSIAPSDTGTIRGDTTQGLMVGGAGAAFGPRMTVDRMDQYGDSITQGIGSSIGGVDTYKVGAAYGIVATPLAKAGITTAGLVTDFPAIAAARPVQARHIMLAPGRNDTAGAPFRASYLSLINLALGACAGYVICRGVTPCYGGVDFGMSTDIQTVVTALGNPRVVYVSVRTWDGIDAVDNTHPTDLGYQQMAVYEIPALEAYLRLGRITEAASATATHTATMSSAQTATEAATATEVSNGVVPSGGTEPRFGYAADILAGDTTSLAALFSSMTNLTGSTSGGHAGTFNTVADTSKFTWLAVLHSAAPSGIHVNDGIGTGGFSGAGLVGIYFGLDVDPITRAISYTDGASNVWDMYRSNGKASTFATFTLS